MNVEAEAALLGGVMISNSALDQIPQLRGEHFAEAVHGEIFDTIRALVAEGKVVTPVTLRPKFDRHPAFEGTDGGGSYLAVLTGGSAAMIGIVDLANQIIELWQLRQIRAKMREALDKTNGDDELTPAEIIGELEAGLMECIETELVKTSFSFADSFDDAIKEIENVSKGEEPAGILINGLENWNLVRGRMEGGDFDLLGGRPSMGKTALAVAVALGAAEMGHGVEFLSLEMSRQKMSRRAIAQLIYRPGASASYEQIIKGRLEREDWKMVMETRDKIAAMPLSISDPHVMYVEDLIPFLRKRKRWFEKRGVTMKLVILDYLGRLLTRKRFNSETEVVSYISRFLKQAAKELDVCMIALAQLSRALEARDNKRPMLADLRQSGSLEQDADNVMFVYRDEYYLERLEPPKDKAEKWTKWADEISAVRDDMEVFSAKRREGALSKRTIKFYTRHQALRDHGPNDWEPDFFEQDDPAGMRG